MAVSTVTTNRNRTVLKSFEEATIADLVTAYNTEESTLAADTSKTWAMTPISFFYDGTNYHLIAYAFYPEYTDNPPPAGQIPELP